MRSLLLLALVVGSTAHAQSHDHHGSKALSPSGERVGSGGEQSEHQHGQPASPEEKRQQPADPHAGHRPAPDADPHAGHRTPGPVGGAEPPAVPADHAADSVYDPAVMARARALLVRENGRFRGHMVRIERLEHQSRPGADAVSWDGEAWLGGDRDRLVVESEGEAEVGGGVEHGEVQLLFSRAIGPWFDVTAGVRQDFGHGPDTTHAALGVKGLAPYWIETEAALFLSTKGDLLGRIEAAHDMRLTQSLVLQPRAELSFAAQDVPSRGIGRGLSDLELGLRLHYQLGPRFAPYVGLEWSRDLGCTARLTRAARDDPESTSFVVGVSFFF